MASSAAEAFRAKQQSNVDATFNAQINSTTSSYNSQIASCNAAADQFGAQAANAEGYARASTAAGGFLNSPQGSALMARHAEALEQQDDVLRNKFAISRFTRI